LAGYARPPASPRTIVGRIRWNMALGGAILPAINLLEVALRNRIHMALTSHCGTAAWYDHAAIPWQPREADAIQTAKSDLAKEMKAIEPDRMVAALSLGFWCSLLSRRYE